MTTVLHLWSPCPGPARALRLSSQRSWGGMEGSKDHCYGQECSGLTASYSPLSTLELTPTHTPGRGCPRARSPRGRGPHGRSPALGSRTPWLTHSSVRGSGLESWGPGTWEVGDPASPHHPGWTWLALKLPSVPQGRGRMEPAGSTRAHAVGGEGQPWASCLALKSRAWSELAGFAVALNSQCCIFGILRMWAGFNEPKAIMFYFSFDKILVFHILKIALILPAGVTSQAWPVQARIHKLYFFFSHNT